MTTATLGPATGTDDGFYVLVTGSTYSSSNSNQSIGSGYGYWLRCPNSPIPQGSTINSATLNLHISAGTATAKVYDFSCNDVDNATYPATASDARALAKTSAVSKSLDATGAPKVLQITGLASLIQAIVNRAGYAEGNALMLLFEYVSGGGLLTATFFEAGSNLWSLEVDYTAPSGAGGTLLLLGC